VQLGQSQCRPDAGLAYETAVKEAKDRVRSACRNANLDFSQPQASSPSTSRCRSAPRKAGAFDMAIAVGLLARKAVSPPTVEHCELPGELALSGRTTPIQGGAAPALACRDQQGLCLAAPRQWPPRPPSSGLPPHRGRPTCELCEHLLWGRQFGTRCDRHSAPGPLNRLADLIDCTGQAQAQRALDCGG